MALRVFFHLLFFDNMTQMGKYHYGSHLRLVRILLHKNSCEFVGVFHKLFLLQSELSPCLRWHMSHFPLSDVKTSHVFEKLTELPDTMWRTWDLALVLTQYYPGFGVSNNSGASTISNFRIRTLWAKLLLDKRTSGPYSLKKGNYLYRYYCVMDPICWCPEKHGVQYTTSVEATVAGEPVPLCLLSPEKWRRRTWKKYKVNEKNFFFRQTWK